MVDVGGWDSAKEVAVKVDDGRAWGLDVALEAGCELEEETLGSGETGRALWKCSAVPLASTVMVGSMMPMGLWSLFRAGVRGGDRGPLTCNVPAGLWVGLSIVMGSVQWPLVCCVRRPDGNEVSVQGGEDT